MKKFFALFWMLMLFCSTNVHSEVVNFEGTPWGESLYGTDYAGITWNKKQIVGDIYGSFWSLPDPNHVLAKPHSGSTYAINAWGANDVSFTFDDKVSFMGAWFAEYLGSDSKTKVRFYDDRGKYSDWLTLGSKPKYLTADFTGSKTIYIERTATNKVEFYEGATPKYANWYSMDDVTYAPITNKSGTEISKSLQLAKYAKDAGYRLPVYLNAATAGVALCGGTLGAACIPVIAATLGVSLIEGMQIGMILVDPPNPLYTEIYQPRTISPFTLDSSSGFSQEMITAANIMSQDQTNLAMLLEAWRVTLERYSAASAAGDDASMQLQSAILEEYILQTSQFAIKAQSSYNEFFYLFEELTGPVLFTPDQIQAAMNSLALDGFSEPVLQVLLSYGLTSSEIENLRLQLLQSSIPTDSVDFYSLAYSSAGGLGELAALTRCVGNSCQSVPEPTTMLLLGLGLIGLIGVRRKFKK